MKRTTKAFSLLELIISIFVFLIVMTSIIHIFVQQMNAYRHARVSQNDLENAEFAMNYVSKTLRTSSLLGTIGASTVNWREASTGMGDFALQEVVSGKKLVLYDFSQELCMRFFFSDQDNDGNSALWVETSDEVNYNEFEKCLEETTHYGSKQKLTSGDVTGTFFVSPTYAPNDITQTIGRVTLGMKILPARSNMLYNEKELHPIYVQTSTSLRDYPSDLSF